MASKKLLALAVVPGVTLLACASLLGDFTVDSTATSDGGTGDGNPATTEGGNDGGAGVDADAGPLLPQLTDAVTVTAGRTHTCAINAAQEVLCWGANGSGQLGVPIAQVARSSFPVKVDVGGKAIAIAAGGAHTCAILDTGVVKCWGSNERGQLGRGTLLPTGPVDVVTPPLTNATYWKKAETITAGASFTCVGMGQGVIGGSSLPDRRFFCWGENVTRQCGTEATNGQPMTTPSLITQLGDGNPSPSFEGFTIASGDDFACAGIYLAAGAAFFSADLCWGGRGVGQIGAPPIAGGFEVSASKYPSTNPDGGTALLLGLFKTSLLAAGAAHACARLEQGGVNPTQLTCWGNNTRGQTGNAALGARPAERVANFDATGVSDLAAGGLTTCVIVNGQVQCIGGNDLGQLGRGTVDVTPHPAFANVLLPPSASAISVGAAHACAVLGTAPGQKGPIACWGQNQNGQLGDGLDIDVGYPDAVDPLKRVRATPVRVAAPK
jgi:alpha-tubulin suppressor-like RCC1 family protein